MYKSCRCTDKYFNKLIKMFAEMSMNETYNDYIIHDVYDVFLPETLDSIYFTAFKH